MRMRLGRRALIAATGGLLTAPSIVRAQGQNGVALVIGNSKYQWEASLQNVRRDVSDVARTFETYGIKTTLVQDATREAMSRALESFEGTAKGAPFATFYFAGHGASWERANYLVPVDADLSDPSAAKTLIKAGVTGQVMKGAANQLYVFDNCRNNPADGWRQLEAERMAGFNTSQQPPGAKNFLTLWSTAPGRIALDGPPGENSPFAACFIRRFQVDSIDLQSTPSKLRRDLLIATQGRQFLWDRNGFQNPFVLAAPAGRKSVAVSSGASSWAGDPSKIVELPKAYAYARENGLPLPSGLIAHRLANGSPDGMKIGSFGYIADSPIGIVPQLLVVMSVDDRQSAEIVQAGKGIWNAKSAKGEAGVYWQVRTATVSGRTLEFVPRDGAARFVLSWSDDNSGSFTMMNDRKAYNSRFTRLDG